VGLRNGRRNEGGGKARGLIAIKCDLREERKARGGGGRGQSCSGAQLGRAEERKGEEEGRGRRRQVGPRCQWLRGKKKKRRHGRGPCGRSLGGPVGRWAERLRRSLFLFFQTQLKPTFKLKFISKLFKLFTKFINLLRPHTSNQNECIAK
jgi:hypothetical protein